MLVTLLGFPLMSQAQWSYDTFKSGKLAHHTATSAPTRNNSELDVFCTNNDSRITMAAYLPRQRMGRRTQVLVEVRVDKEQIWRLPASRHSMALVFRHTPKELLNQLALGNRVRVTYPVSGKKTDTDIFTLSRSSRALADLKNACY